MAFLSAATLFLLLLLSVLPWPSSPYSYMGGPSPVEVAAPCPGLYCGRTALNETHNSGCGQCPRGWKVSNNTHSLCERCNDSPANYDWFFFAFHVILIASLHCVAIDHRQRVFSREVVAMHVCALAEVAAAAVATLLLSEPVGSMELRACRVRQLSDWYTFLHNPRPNYEETLHCTQEVVYPMYTMVFVFYGVCGMLMLLVRPCITSRYTTYTFKQDCVRNVKRYPFPEICRLYTRRGRNAIYAALYFLPALALIHAIAGGLVYMSYPYIVFILSVISSAAHFAFKLDQSAKSLISDCFTNSRDFIILVGHWLLHAFGILAITQDMSTFSLSLISLVPLPALFYIATAKFTDPDNFTNDNL